MPESLVPHTPENDPGSVSVEMHDALLKSEREFIDAFEQRWEGLSDKTSTELIAYADALQDFLHTIETDAGYIAFSAEASMRFDVSDVTDEKRYRISLAKWMTASILSTTAALTIALQNPDKKLLGSLLVGAATLPLVGALIRAMFGPMSTPLHEVFRMRLDKLHQFEGELRAKASSEKPSA
jgi:hypothetical protein